MVPGCGALAPTWLNTTKDERKMMKRVFSVLFLSVAFLAQGCGKTSAPGHVQSLSLKSDLASSHGTALGEGHVSIAYPRDGASVGHVITVNGSVAGTKADVWVVVHPVAMGSYWVQKKTTTTREGRWHTKAVIGALGSVGESFEIMAVHGARGVLREGDVLSDWPEAETISGIVRVTRE